ncbi:MAG: radical SAM protein [Anaerolineae bacterium]|nr:radical SAM protein [Anaerolineae bacterium]
MVRDIQAKVLLSRVKGPDPWFGLYYNMNLYRGCQHRCIYCDSRSECYRIDGFDQEVLVKINAVELLRHELPRKRVRGTIGTGSMNDPYMPLERERRLTWRALGTIAEFGFPVHILTKSDLVLRDIDLLREVARVYAAVSFTITTADDALGKKLEPGASLVSERFAALAQLASQGIYTGIVLMPVLPFIEDTAENIAAIVERAHESGAAYIIPSFGMTLRDRQRAYYYARLDEHFPGLRQRYEQRYGERYGCRVPQAGRLEQHLQELCGRYGIPRWIEPYPPQPVQRARPAEPESPRQLPLL